MGFFGKLFEKKTCDICGGEIGLLGNRKLEDGNCCKHCAGKLSPWFDDRRHSTIAQIQEQLAYREANRQAVAAFQPTLIFGEDKELRIDERRGKFLIAERDEENPDVLDLSQVQSVDLDVDETRYEVMDQDEDGNAVSYDPPRYRYEYNFDVVVRVSHPYFDDMRMRLNGCSVEVYPPASYSPFAYSGTHPGQHTYEYQKYERMGQEIRDRLLHSRPVMAEAPVQAAPRPKFCPNCGSPVSGGKFCGECGAALN